MGGRAQEVKALQIEPLERLILFQSGEGLEVEESKARVTLSTEVPLFGRKAACSAAHSRGDGFSELDGILRSATNNGWGAKFATQLKEGLGQKNLETPSRKKNLAYWGHEIIFGPGWG